MQGHIQRRIYRPMIQGHFHKNRQMLFLMGPRQVGKTTLCFSFKEESGSNFTYLNWDNLNDREILIAGPSKIAEYAHLSVPRKSPPLLAIDEIHKFKDWKNLLKGFFDTYSHSGEVRILVTGSARLDTYNKGGDSLMGRYFSYRIHPFSCAELIHDQPYEKEIRSPKPLAQDHFDALMHFGGFPEPFLKGDEQFLVNWQRIRSQQFFQEDVREFSRVSDLHQMELLAHHIRNQCGSLTSFTSLSKKVRVSIETVRRWIDILKLLYYCFPVHPWSSNIPRSLLKEPKYYMWDWSQVKDIGQKAENFIASHLLKACHFWTDSGLGEYSLNFIRDKQQNEVDFLVTKNQRPWFLVEVKNNSDTISPQLAKFQKLTGAKHAFQVMVNAEYRDIDCFSYSQPVCVPAKTFLSQLV